MGFANVRAGPQNAAGFGLDGPAVDHVDGGARDGAGAGAGRGARAAGRPAQAGVPPPPPRRPAGRAAAECGNRHGTARTRGAACACAIAKNTQTLIESKDGADSIACKAAAGRQAGRRAGKAGTRAGRRAAASSHGLGMGMGRARQGELAARRASRAGSLPRGMAWARYGMGVGVRGLVAMVLTRPPLAPPAPRPPHRLPAAAGLAAPGIASGALAPRRASSVPACVAPPASTVTAAGNAVAAGSRLPSPQRGSVSAAIQFSTRPTTPTTTPQQHRLPHKIFDSASL